ncbi:hypothetical protein DFP72DRAFT_1076318 [Ephemerocybe angulata]|uniref:Uncharacterized protein n=1 Tax=Ephemerocybe angulata TaxID=980116 RepID=A0A8H6HIQ0_9AGAR|nr:hypothetical protein DFP72DRAFT_1076318 [Tulosesus angulatus]
MACRILLNIHKSEADEACTALSSRTFRPRVGIWTLRPWITIVRFKPDSKQRSLRRQADGPRTSRQAITLLNFLLAVSSFILNAFSH